MLFELKRIVLGEFMDDLELASRISEAFGAQDDSSETALEQKVGREKLQIDSILSSLGATLILVSLIFLLVIIVVLLSLLLLRRGRLSEKWKLRIKQLKEKVFYNPIIRYFMLNFLKFNFSSAVILFAAQ